jgi:hypothetical protein
MLDREIIEGVNRIAQQLAAAAGMEVAAGTRFDLSRYPAMLDKWHAAVEIYKAETGIDGQAALTRHEAEIRSNAAVLHVERR